MVAFVVELESLAPLLMHRWTESAENDQQTRKMHVMHKNPREEAESFAYRLQSGGLYLPGAAIARMLREAGGAHKQRGSRKSLKYVVPAAVLVADDYVPLKNFQDKAITDFEIDSRPVVIPATKGRIMRHRPKILEWRIAVNLEVDETSIAPDTVQELFTDAGRKIGVGDFRPEKGGPFGRFMMVNWSAIAKPKPSLKRVF